MNYEVEMRRVHEHYSSGFSQAFHVDWSHCSIRVHTAFSTNGKRKILTGKYSLLMISGCRAQATQSGS